jgi:hypothetical protein
MWNWKRPSLKEYTAVRPDESTESIEAGYLPQSKEGFNLTNSIDHNKKPQIWYRTRYAIISIAVLILVIAGVGVVYKSSREAAPPCLAPERRMEWRELDNEDKSQYIAAVMCLQQFPSIVADIGRLSDDFPWLHRHIARTSETKPLADLRLF